MTLRPTLPRSVFRRAVLRHAVLCHAVLRRAVPPAVALASLAALATCQAIAGPTGHISTGPIQTVPIQTGPVRSTDSQSADSICGKRDAVITRLRDQYGETRRGYGLQRETSVVEVYASESTGSWTILLTMPNGVACLVAAGEHWAPVTATAQPAGPRL